MGGIADESIKKYPSGKPFPGSETGLPINGKRLRGVR
jgi:hypothetical protein